MKKKLLYLTEIALCLLLSFLPRVIALWPQEIMTALSILCAYALYPAAAFILPFLAAKAGNAAFLCALPPFPLYMLAWIFSGLPLPAVPALLTLLFSVFGACTGAEIFKRRQ